MEIIALGDTHGRADWQRIVNKNSFDKVVFIGDYFDTHENISPRQQIDNFKDIIAYKISKPDSVILLFGNHDFHYLPNIAEHYSGFEPMFKINIGEALCNALNDELLQMCYVADKFLFSHAGVTKTWCNANGIDLLNLEQSINDLFKHKPNSFRFTAGDYYSNIGDEICQTPIWVRPNSLIRDKIDGYVQVVGHTMQDALVIQGGVLCIDTLGTSGEYLLIKDGVMKALK